MRRQYHGSGMDAAKGPGGVGRRHGPEGLLKYAESQTIATARVFNLDAPLRIPTTLWQKSLLPIVRTVMKLPGRH